MSYRIRRLRKHSPALDITAFMNMIVVLVPFLLTTTVFSRLAVLELSLPAQSSAFDKLKGDLQLEIVIRGDALEVQDRIGQHAERGSVDAQHNHPAQVVQRGDRKAQHRTQVQDRQQFPPPDRHTEDGRLRPRQGRELPQAQGLDHIA